MRFSLSIQVFNQLFNFLRLRKKSNKLKFGLVNCMNNRGLGTESRLLKAFFDEHFDDVSFEIYKIPAGRKAKEFDGIWQEKPSFKRWLNVQDIVMTIEHFMPKMFDECRKRGIKTIWRPNQEWILPIYGKSDYEMLDYILTPQNACADFLEEKYQLDNVVRNPWITDLPIVKKSYSSDTKTRFLFNAGRGGIGNRRNHTVVIEAFKKILGERKDIEFTLKTPVDVDVSSLSQYKDKNFTYICKNTSYSKNLQHYAEADFSIAPSKWEGVGFALLESLYCGTPVITVNAPPMNEWVSHNETGYLVEATFPDVELPIPFDKINMNGLNWVKAAQCNVDDLVAAILCLADNKKSFYDTFNQKNQDILDDRQKSFKQTFRVLIDNVSADIKAKV